MIENHIDSQALHRKIVELFEYRLFPNLLQASEMSQEEIQHFWGQLIDLQTSIYLLDAHLEAHEETNPEILKWHWAQMREKLEDITGQLPEDHDYFQYITMYEKHELDLRKGISPLSYDIMTFYYYKSCDVKLLRRLIYEKCQLTHQLGDLEDWKYYDLITEVNDDIEDIWEDKAFINGNLFLVSLLLQGRSSTENLLSQLMNKILSDSHDRNENIKTIYNDFLHRMTVKRIEETRNLMIQQFEDTRIMSIGEARISVLTNTMIKSIV